MILHVVHGIKIKTFDDLVQMFWTHLTNDFNRRQLKPEYYEDPDDATEMMNEITDFLSRIIWDKYNIILFDVPYEQDEDYMYVVGTYSREFNTNTMLSLATPPYPRILKTKFHVHHNDIKLHIIVERDVIPSEEDIEPPEMIERD